jgi:hypothetical protein
VSAAARNRLETAGLGAASWCAEPFGLDLSAAACAGRAAAAAFAAVVGWSADLRDATVGPGDVIRPPAGRGPAADLVVVARDLSYDPRRPPGRQVVNHIMARPAAAADAPAPPEPARGLVPLIGQVVGLDDSRRHGRVKLRLPWHEVRGANPSRFDGVWCAVPQSFGGADPRGRCHGAVVLPALWDWCIAVADPRGFVPPVLLGAVYRGDRARTSGLVGDPALDRLLAATPGGVVVLARDDPGGGAGSLTLAVRDAGGRAVASLILDRTGVRVERAG